MATEGGEDLTPAVNSLNLNGSIGENEQEIETDEFYHSWGFNLPELYRLATKFYKEKEGKAVKLTYRDKVRLISLTKQVSFGQYRPDVSPEVGVLDVVGQDRRQAWQSLADMPREAAMSEFVRVVDQLCPLFKPYIQAHRAEHEEQQRRRQEEEESRKKDEERQRLEVDARQQQQNEHNRIQQQESTIRAALNQQTAIQFRQYAEQQCPTNTEQQAVLISQLQEQHFQQYMQQVYQQQLMHQQQQFQQLQALHNPAAPSTQPSLPPTPAPHTVTTTPSTNASTEEDTQPTIIPSILPTVGNNVTMTTNALPHNEVLPPGAPLPEPPPQLNGVGDDSADGETEDHNMLPSSIAAASMWTRKDSKDFKTSIQKDPDSIIKVGSGETVTVRVPTHEDGTCLFWEFATDSYDIGFGVYFEWTVSPSNQVSVHVSESSDEEDLEEGEDGETKGDVEKGPAKKDNRPPTDEIIPVYRRDCHEEVYCGSHMYPGRGVYLLKFDNSYSLWRSKSLYYRVYYTR